MRPHHTNLATLMMATALLAAGCFGHVGYSASVSGEAYGAELVYVAPGVQVIADFDDSIFFADNFYWRFDRGGWYRSPNYRGSWVVAPPPPALLRIDRPRGYVHYRPAGWVSRREPPRQPTHQPPPRQGQQTPPARFLPPAPPRPTSPGPGDHGRQDGRGRGDRRGRGDDHGRGDDRGHDDHGRH